MHGTLPEGGFLKRLSGARQGLFMQFDIEVNENMTAQSD
jgi:hypothetical protein